MMSGAQVTAGLSELLRRGRELLAPLRAREGAAARALDRLERDLLPRAAGGTPYLVVGIVGPNNAGKSALFNALVGERLSPSVPAGGATRRLVGAAHPELLARLAAEPTLTRFRLRADATASSVASKAVQATTDPAELLAVPEPRLPAALMLIDTPDFDSILADNRLASESLLAVADLVVAIVTRHTYQNREVVAFLEGWLDHGRPWMLVYNEAVDADIARAHAAKLAGDVGTPPLATFWAPFNVAIQIGTAPLEPRALRPEDRAGTRAMREIAREGAPLREVLFHLPSIAEIKARAFAASLTHLRADVDAVVGALGAEARSAGDVLVAAAARARQTGVRIAAGAMPGGPFIEAFRQVLARRSNPISRRWRLLLRQVRIGLESIPRLFFRAGSDGAADPAEVKLAQIEAEQLDQQWPAFWEELVRDLGAEGRHRARAAADATIIQWLEADLRSERRPVALAQARQALAAATPDFETFRVQCEALIEAAIEARGFDFDIQAVADLATLAPIALAAAVIIKTGGLGSDIAAAGGGAVSSFLMEKYTHLLGSTLTAEARERWTDLRGAALAGTLIDAALEQAAPRLRALAERDTALAAELRAWSLQLP